MRRSTRRSSVGLPAAEDIRTKSSQVPILSTKFSLPSFIRRVERLTNDQRKAIRKTGFGSLLEIPCQMLSKTLLAELMERWTCKKQAFVLGPGAVTITLMDVALILGLRVVGQPVVLREDEPFSDLEKEYGASLWNRTITITSLESRLDSIGAEAADDDFIRTFLLFAFGVFLFPSTNGKVDSRYLSLLAKLDDVPRFAWGAAVLEDVFMWLRKRKEEKTQCIGGCLIFLQIWSYEHIDIGRPKESDSCLTFPRLCRWENSRSHQRQWISERFRELHIQQITWKLQPTSHELQYDVIKQLLEVVELESTSDGRETKFSYPLQVFEVGSESEMDSIKEGTSRRGSENSEELLASDFVTVVEVQTEDMEHPATPGRSDLNDTSTICNNEKLVGLETSGQALEDQIVDLKEQNKELKCEIESLRNQLMSIPVLEEDNKELRRQVDDLTKENQNLTLFARHFIDRVETILSKYAAKAT